MKGSAPMQVLQDGKTTEAGDREGILKAANPASVALKYKDIIDLKRTERSALVKGLDGPVSTHLPQMRYGLLFT